MKLCDQSSSQMDLLHSGEFGRIAQHLSKGKGRKEERGPRCILLCIYKSKKYYVRVKSIFYEICLILFMYWIFKMSTLISSEKCSAVKCYHEKDERAQ